MVFDTLQNGHGKIHFTAVKSIIMIIIIIIIIIITIKAKSLFSNLISLYSVVHFFRWFLHLL